MYLSFYALYVLLVILFFHDVSSTSLPLLPLGIAVVLCSPMGQLFLAIVHDLGDDVTDELVIL